MTPRILPDRDNVRNWYLDEDVTHVMHNGDVLQIGKGYRFDGHSTRPFHHIFKQNDTDILAALVHDFLLDTRPWHRYSRKFIDQEYYHIMQTVSYGYRKKVMPFVVRCWGFLMSFGWTECRGDYQGNVFISVKMGKSLSENSNT